MLQCHNIMASLPYIIKPVKHPIFSYFLKLSPIFSKKSLFFPIFLGEMYISKFGQWSNLHIKFTKKLQKTTHFFTFKNKVFKLWLRTPDFGFNKEV